LNPDKVRPTALVILMFFESFMLLPNTFSGEMPCAKVCGRCPVKVGASGPHLHNTMTSNTLLSYHGAEGVWKAGFSRWSESRRFLD